MIKRIKEYFEYRKNVRIVKGYIASQMSSLITNKAEYLEGVKNILASAATITDPTEIQKMIVHEVATLVHEDNKDK